MKNNAYKYFLMACFAFVHLLPLLQAQTTISLDEVKGKYGEFIIAYKKTAVGRTYIDKKVVEPTNDTLLASFVSNNRNLIELVTTNYLSVSSDELVNIKDSLKLQAKFAALIKEDALVNKYFLPFLCAYYQSSGYTVEGWKTAKPVYSFDEMIDVAIKFFELKDIDSRGNFKTRIGISEDGLVKTLDQRKPLLEIYCLNVIKKQNYQAYQALNKARKAAEKLQLGLNESDRLLRAEGAIYALISQDERFRALLKAAYDKNATTLPFIINE